MGTRDCGWRHRTSAPSDIEENAKLVARAADRLDGRFGGARIGELLAQAHELQFERALAQAVGGLARQDGMAASAPAAPVSQALLQRLAVCAIVLAIALWLSQCG